MNFRPALPLLVFSGLLSAQMTQLRPQGGGSLKIGDMPYRFEPTDLLTAPPKGGLPGVVRLEGNLVPKDGSRTFHMTLTVMKDGSLLYAENRAQSARRLPGYLGCHPKDAYPCAQHAGPPRRASRASM